MLNGRRSYIIPPPELRSSSPLSQGDIEMEIGKTEATQEARAEAKFALIMPSDKEEKTAKRD